VRYQYRYDKNGMRDTMIDNDGVHAYAYDAIYQIVQATHPGVQNPLEQFSYDSVGNRLTDLTRSNYQYNELNQLLEDDSCTYAYDLDGNMVQQVNKNTGDTTTFTYDIENKLVQVGKPGMLAQYSYDAFGRRIGKTVNGVVKHYRYDRENLIFEMNGQDSIAANYTFGPGIDNTLMMHRNDKNYFYAKDGLGSVTTISDSLGTVVQEYKYGVFGGIVEQSADPVESPFTYTSRELDKETGNYYFRARYYDPQIGRFLNEDPIGLALGELCQYKYSKNCPINFIDPSGELIQAIIVIGAVVVTIYVTVEIWQQIQKSLEKKREANSKTCNASPLDTSLTIEEWQDSIREWEKLYAKTGAEAFKIAQDVPGTGVTGPMPTSPYDALGEILKTFIKSFSHDTSSNTTSDTSTDTSGSVGK
jgi:RHS repeat-associated protein